MIGNRNKRAKAPGPAPEDLREPAADPDRLLPDDASSDEIAVLGEAQHQAAAELGRQAERDEAAAAEILAAARAEAARIMAAGEAQAAPCTAAATAAREQAATRSECGQRLARTAGIAAEAEAADARVAALEAERDTLAEERAQIAASLAEQANRRRDLDLQLTAALAGTDDDLLVMLKGRLDGIGAREEHLRGRLAPVVARLDEIGDGQMSPIWPQKELAEARRVADPGRRSVRAALNHAQPGRPEAVADRAREHDRLVGEAASRLAAEAQRGPDQPRTIVMQ